MHFLQDVLQRWFRKVHSYFVPTRHNAYRPRLLRTPWLLFFLALILTTEGVLLANVFASASARDYLAAVLPAEVVRLTNLERGFTNTPTLKENALLTQAAEAKARDMARNGYFAHVGPDGKEPWAWIKEAGYSYRSAGENLAVRFTESSDVVHAWMASPTHKANIVKRSYTEIGVGVAQGTYKGSPATFVVQYFGRPAATNTGFQSSATVAAEVGPQVLGASAEAEARGLVAQTVASVGTVPSAQALAVLIGAALFLFVLVSLTFLVNIQVQPVDLLLGGAGVAAVAVAFLVLNFSFVAPLGAWGQTASVFDARQEGVLIGEGVFVEQPDEGIMTLPSEGGEGTLNP